MRLDYIRKQIDKRKEILEGREYLHVHEAEIIICRMLAERYKELKGEKVKAGAYKDPGHRIPIVKQLLELKPGEALKVNFSDYNKQSPFNSYIANVIRPYGVRVSVRAFFDDKCWIVTIKS